NQLGSQASRVVTWSVWPHNYGTALHAWPHLHISECSPRVVCRGAILAGRIGTSQDKQEAPFWPSYGKATQETHIRSLWCELPRCKR
ncbi:hypothetical protein M419DRAFT_125429, partial [Trichoderma reesei RUT C-30]